MHRYAADKRADRVYRGFVKALQERETTPTAISFLTRPGSLDSKLTIIRRLTIPLYAGYLPSCSFQLLLSYLFSLLLPEVHSTSTRCSSAVPPFPPFLDIDRRAIVRGVLFNARLAMRSSLGNCSCWGNVCKVRNFRGYGWLSFWGEFWKSRIVVLKLSFVPLIEECSNNYLVFLARSKRWEIGRAEDFLLDFD